MDDQPALQTLDNHALLRILSFLKQPQDIAAAERSCRLLQQVGHTNSLWELLILRDFDAQVHTGVGAKLDLQTVYERMAATRDTQYSLRYAAAYTDGGCDEGKLCYWVDNMFVPSHNTPHCSEASANITAVGVLLPDGSPDDAAMIVHRSYLVERCAAAGCALLGVPGAPPQTREQAVAALEGWTLSGLERFFLDLYQDLQAPHPTWGQLLLKDAADTEAERERLAEKYEQVCTVSYLSYQVEKVPSEVLQAAAVGVAAPALRAVTGTTPVVDTRFMAWFSDPSALTSTGLVRTIVASRTGHFSAPVQCGALLLGQYPCSSTSGGGATDITSGSRGDATMTFGMRCAATLAHDPWVAALDDITTLEQVMEAIRTGALPPLQGAWRQHGGVEWVEFKPLSASMRSARAARGWLLRPVVWWRFFPHSEHEDDPALEQQEGEAAPVAAAAHPPVQAAFHAAPAAPALLTEDPQPMEVDVQAAPAMRLGQQWQQTEQGGGLGASISNAPTQEQQQWQRGVCAPVAVTCERPDPAPGVSALPAPALHALEADHNGRPHLAARIPLEVARAGNVAVVRLISSEDRMDVYNDPHDLPNIDVEYVALRGAAMRFPPGTQLS